MKLTKEQFNAGSPFSSWLKEELTGEVSAYLHDLDSRGLIQKYKVHVDDKTEALIMSIKKFDDLPVGLQKVATDIIRSDLDQTFKV